MTDFHALRVSKHVGVVYRPDPAQFGASCVSVTGQKFHPGTFAELTDPCGIQVVFSTDMAFYPAQRSRSPSCPGNRLPDSDMLGIERGWNAGLLLFRVL